MGIPRFLSRYVSQIPGVYVNIADLGDIAAVWYDFNSVIHETRSVAYGESDLLSPKEAENLKTQAKENPGKAHSLHLKLIRETLEFILETFQPKNLLFLCIDGTSCLSKCFQQRRRRYLSSKSTHEQILPSNAISPGTEFMFTLDKDLKEILGSLKQKYDIPLVLYSSHLVPGEGEAKILDNIRSGKYNFVGKHIASGLDADLIPLTLGLGRDDIYMYQGKDRFGKWYTNVISVAAVRDHMLIQTGFLDDTGRPRFNFNGLNVAKDITSLFAFLANDFLPSFIGFNQQPIATDEILEAYSRYMKTTSYTRDASPNLNYLTDENGIVMANMMGYLIELAKSEIVMIRRQRVNTEYLPSRILNESTTVENEESDKPKVKVDIAKLKTLWYNQFDYTNIPKGYSFTLINDDYKNFIYQKFYEGINWFYTYYVLGQTHINLNWAYPFSFAPLLSDLVTYNYQETNDYKNREASLTPLLALLVIMPPKNFNLIPPELRDIIEKGALCDTAPTDFEILRDGVFVGSEGIKDKTKIPEGSIPIIPMLGAERLIYEVSKLSLDINLLKKYLPKKQEEIFGTRTAERQLTREFSRIAISARNEGRGRGEYRGRGNRGERGTGEYRGNYRGGERGTGEYRGNRGYRGERGNRGRGRGTGESRGRGYRGTGENRGRGGGTRYNEERSRESRVSEE